MESNQQPTQVSEQNTSPPKPLRLSKFSVIILAFGAIAILGTSLYIFNVEEIKAASLQTTSQSPTPRLLLQQ